MRLYKRAKYANGPEDEAAKCLDYFNKSFTRRGYPDFTVHNEDGSIYGFIEVKPDGEEHLRKDQEVFKSFCEKHGVPFIMWQPSDGREKIQKFLEERYSHAV